MEEKYILLILSFDDEKESFCVFDEEDYLQFLRLLLCCSFEKYSVTFILKNLTVETISKSFADELTSNLGHVFGYLNLPRLIMTSYDGDETDEDFKNFCEKWT